jgi:uncharacterized Zn finger protein
MRFKDFGWRPYVPVAERRRKAALQMLKLSKKGHPVSAVVIEGRAIVTTFWGKAWCENLERYGDYANRLPRGRTYVRNGSVVDLQIEPGKIHALVCGAEMYTVKLEVAPVAKAQWRCICKDCAGSIGSLIELLQGRLSNGVMERICRQKGGLFPAPAEIRLSCSCPDWAEMCKHVAAVMYGIGARFDHQPELLFRLRQVDEKELIESAGKATPAGEVMPGSERLLQSEDLAGIFGLDMAEPAGTAAGPAGSTPKKPKPRARKAEAVPTPKPGARKKAAPKRTPKKKAPARKPRSRSKE